MPTKLQFVFIKKSCFLPQKRGKNEEIDDIDFQRKIIFSPKPNVFDRIATISEKNWIGQTDERQLTWLIVRHTGFVKRYIGPSHGEDPHVLTARNYENTGKKLPFVKVPLFGRFRDENGRSKRKTEKNRNNGFTRIGSSGRGRYLWNAHRSRFHVWSCL